MSVFIIAEIGSNYGGSLDRALALIDAAADAGADAAKFQRFRVDRFIVPRADPESLRRYELPDEWLPTLKARCDERGIEFMCTAFDLESLDVIDPYVKRHKVGSYEVPEWHYVQAVLKKKKPVIASRGLIGDTFQKWHDDMRVTMLDCVSKYPAPIAGYLKGAKQHRSDEFGDDQWGVSDHTLHPTIVPAAAVALGASVVEKHMTIGGAIRPELRFPDFPVSIQPTEFAEMVEAVRLTESAVRG